MCVYKGNVNIAEGQMSEQRLGTRARQKMQKIKKKRDLGNMRKQKQGRQNQGRVNEDGEMIVKTI